MTAVVGIVDSGSVYLAADSAASGGGEIIIRKDPKLFYLGKGISIGIAGSYRLAQIVAYKMRIPPFPKDMPAEEYLITRFVPKLAQAFVAHGKRLANGNFKDGDYLVAARGRLFHLQPDFAVAEVAASYNAIGSGAGPAIGVLHALRDRPPAERLRLALEAAEALTDSVRRPWLALKDGEPFSLDVPTISQIRKVG
jgi:ATP-dependent protease HslVU (ClpYQ) peptidase subunit